MKLDYKLQKTSYLGIFFRFIKNHIKTNSSFISNALSKNKWLSSMKGKTGTKDLFVIRYLPLFLGNPLATLNIRFNSVGKQDLVLALFQ